MNTMLFNCSLSNSQLHFILKNSSGFHTQKQLQDLDQQRTGHGVAGHGSALWKCALVLTSMPVDFRMIFCLLFWMYDLGFEASTLGRMCLLSVDFCWSKQLWKWWLFITHQDQIGKVICTAHLIWLAFFTTGCLIQSDGCLHNILACEIQRLRLYVSSDSLRSWWDPTTTTFGYLMKHLSMNDCERKIEPRSPLNSVKWCTVMRHDASHVA